MKILMAGLFAASAATAAYAQQQSAAEPSASGRQMARCGALFQMLAGYMPPEQKAAYDFAASSLLSEASKDASAAEVQGWMNEYFESLPPKDAGRDALGAYIKKSKAECEEVTNNVISSALVRIGPEASAGNTVSARYPDGRPESAIVFGKQISFSDAEGDSCEAPISLSGTEDREARIRSQYMWLEDQRPEWKVSSHSTSYSEDVTSNEALERVRIYSVFKMSAGLAGSKTVCFDTTASSKPELLRAARR